MAVRGPARKVLTVRHGCEPMRGLAAVGGDDPEVVVGHLCRRIGIRGLGGDEHNALPIRRDICVRGGADVDYILRRECMFWSALGLSIGREQQGGATENKPERQNSSL